MNENGPIAKRVAYNTVVQFAGRIAVAVLAIITTRLIAERLGVHDYGRYTTIFAYITFFGAMADFGFFWYLVREVSKDKDQTEKITANVLTIRTLFALGVVAIGTIMAFAVPNYDPVVRYGIVLVALSSLWVSISNTLIGVFQANQRMDYPVINEVVGRIGSLIVVYLVIRSGWDLLPIVIGSLSGGLIVFLLNAWFVRRYTRLRFGFDRGLWKEIMRENTTLGLSILLSIVYFKIDSVILSILKPSTDVGIYGAPYRVVEILLAFPAMFMGAVFPDLARLIHEENLEKVKIVLQKAFDLLVVAGWGITVSVIVLAGPIIHFTTKGEESFLTTSTITLFNQPITAAITLQILAVAVGIAFLGNFFFSAIVAHGAQKQLIFSNLVNSLVNIGLNLIFIPILTYVGAASVTIISELIVVGFGTAILRRRLGFAPSLRSLWLSGVISIFLGVFLYLIRDQVHVVIAGLLGLGFYTALAIACGLLRGVGPSRTKQVESN